MERQAWFASLRSGWKKQRLHCERGWLLPSAWRKV
jgi:hypothetical protein